MPSLIPEILFEIGKNLFVSRDSEYALDSVDEIIRFGLSGKEPLKAIKNVFITVTTVKINCYKIALGWGKQCYAFDSEEIPKYLFYSLGESVKTLFIESEVQPFLQRIVHKIIAKKQLISFYTFTKRYHMKSAEVAYIHRLIPFFSTTLKHLTMPCQLLIENFCDEIRPASLALNSYYPYFIPVDLPSLTQKRSREFYSSVKRLTFNNITSDLRYSATRFKNAIKLFPSLKSLQFNAKKHEQHSTLDVFGDINSLIDIIKESKNLPSTVKYAVLNFVYFEIFKTSNVLETFIRDNDVDSTFYYFRRTIESASSQKVTLEVLLPKNQKTVLEFHFFDC